jgi:hypothetical protein
MFPDFKVGLLHGQMKPDEKTAIMDSFKRGELHVLVSTTVVEVGVDVPNATADGHRACRALRAPPSSTSSGAGWAAVRRSPIVF